ncbi:MAG: hypothetical protein JXL80_06280 [Planctomycetes bacterium]|nr:hypothetical protein [Planctomycetota bacterium]
MNTIDPRPILDALYDADTEKFFDAPADVPLFDRPMVAVARADDPWFARMKEVIGGFYWTPQEALAKAVPGVAARSVVCWCLPVARVAREDNRRETSMPARQWAYVRTFGEEFVTRLRHGMEQRLREMGYAAVAPAVMPENQFVLSPTVGLSSQWSERHMAFVAGLGTFGLSGGLITRRGIAHRLGSVVTDALMTPTPRPYGDDPFAWCLRKGDSQCGACIRRCPAGSIGRTTAERDKEACRLHAYSHIKKLGLEKFGWEGTYGCGLCQTAVPCEDRNPTERRSD